MPDLEKVIKGLDSCAKWLGKNDWDACDNCPYHYSYYSYDDNNCMAVLCNNALALLKEQEWKLLTEDDDGNIHGLPGDDGQYLMTDGKDIWIDEYVDGVEDGIFLDSGRDIREIMAWMYMPVLPKQDRR